jgi:hypothetical protein
VHFIHTVGADPTSNLIVSELITKRNLPQIYD